MGTLGLAARQVGLGQVALGVGLGLATYVGAWDRSPARQAWDRLPIGLTWAWPTVFRALPIAHWVGFKQAFTWAGLVLLVSETDHGFRLSFGQTQDKPTVYWPCHK